MTEKITYVCDICGKEFEDEENCLAHEKEERFKQFESKVAMFNCNGVSTDDIEEVFTIWVADMEAFHYVNDLLSEAGYCDLWKFEDQMMNRGPYTFYTNDNGDWRYLDHDLSELLKLEKNVKEVLDNRPKM